MFKKLKIKFVLINMSLLTFVFLGIFALIYVLVTMSLNESINKELNELIKSQDRNIFSDSNYIEDGFKDDERDSKSHGAPPGALNSLILLVDEDNNILNYELRIGIEYDDIDKFLEKTLKNKEIEGTISIDDTSYAYLIEKKDDNYIIAYIDRSSQQETLFLIFKIFLFVSGSSLMILFLISYYFANKAIKPIKDVFEKQRQFIADASHELKTPLTIIKTNSAIIMGNHDEKVKEQEKWIRYINSQVDRMTELIGDMISLAKIEDHNEKTLKTEFNISELLKNSLLAFEAILYEGNLRLGTKIEKNIYIKAEKESIKKLMNVLIDNAIKYTPSNNEIFISLKTDKNKIVFKIKNNGVEIPEDYIDKVFERFYRPDNSRSREGGNGLGLSIAKSIIKSHKGKINVKSGNNYTAFKFELPLK
jgi:signal transduction histidine kinase